jgi:hypothetical protein
MKLKLNTFDAIIIRFTITLFMSQIFDFFAVESKLNKNDSWNLIWLLPAEQNITLL